MQCIINKKTNKQMHFTVNTKETAELFCKQNN